jgi:hypothetical protein
MTKRMPLARIGLSSGMVWAAHAVVELHGEVLAAGEHQAQALDAAVLFKDVGALLVAVLPSLAALA